MTAKKKWKYAIKRIPIYSERNFKMIKGIFGLLMFILLLKFGSVVLEFILDNWKLLALAVILGMIVRHFFIGS